MRITREFLYVDLRKYGTELTYFQIFARKLLISITIHDTTKSWIISLTKTEGLLPSNSQFLMKKTQQKTPRSDNKNVTNHNHTEPKRTKTVI